MKKQPDKFIVFYREERQTRWKKDWDYNNPVDALSRVMAWKSYIGVRNGIASVRHEARIVLVRNTKSGEKEIEVYRTKIHENSNQTPA